MVLHRPYHEMAAGTVDFFLFVDVIHSNPFPVNYCSWYRVHGFFAEIQFIIFIRSGVIAIIVYGYSQQLKCMSFTHNHSYMISSVREYHMISIHWKATYQTYIFNAWQGLKFFYIPWAMCLEINIYKIILFISHRIIHHVSILFCYDK